MTNVTRKTELATAARLASRPLERGIGLMGRRALPDGGGLIIEPCNSIVTFFMRFPIDVAFLDGDGRVLHLLHGIVPWRTSKIVRGSKRVVELPPGTLAQSATQLGDVVEICPA